MHTRAGRWLTLALLLAAAVPAHTALPVVTIGVVIDGPWERNDEIRQDIQKEVLDLTRGEFDVRFPAGKRIQSDWTLAGVRGALARLLADPDVDVVLAAGVIASNEACRQGDLPKPVVAPFVLDRLVQGIPYREGASGVPNLCYITFPSDIRRDIQLFREVVPFKRMVLLHSGVVYEAVPELRRNVERLTASMDLRVSFVSYETSVAEALAAIPRDTQAAMVAPLLGTPDGAFRELVKGLIDRGLPSYSLTGTADVARGILAGAAPDFNIPRLARRVAINVQRILLGEDPATFQVLFTREELLTINMETARAIGVFPSWRVLTEAQLLNQARQADAPVLTLKSAVDAALRANADLAASEHTVRAGRQDVRAAQAALLPQAGLAAGLTAVDDDLGGPLQAGRSAQASATLSQVIFSEPALANVRIQRLTQQGTERSRDATRLDVVAEAAEAYLNVLRAKTAERIRRDNLQLTSSNLELARLREAIGASGVGEVYRWESQIATDRKAVIQANAHRNQAEIALNRVLHRGLEDPFQTVDTGVHDEAFLAANGRLSPYLDNPWSFRAFRAFMVKEGLARSPELQGLNARLQAQARAQRSAER